MINDCLNLSGQIKRLINYLSATDIAGNKKKQSNPQLRLKP